MRITTFGRFGVALIVLSLVLSLGVGRGVSGILLVAAGFFVFAYESMRRPLLEQGLCRSPWFVPHLAVEGGIVTVRGILLSRTIRLNDIVRARLVYQESIDALTGVDDALSLETRDSVVQVTCTCEGFGVLMQSLRDMNIGVQMIRAHGIDID